MASPHTNVVDHLAHQHTAAARGSRPGNPLEPFRSSQQHLARDELPQQRHDSRAAPSPAPPRYTGPHSARPDHRSSSAPPGPRPAGSRNCNRAHPPSRHLLAPRSPDKSTTAQIEPGSARPPPPAAAPRPRRRGPQRPAAPPVAAADGAQGRRPGFLPPCRRRPTRAGHPDGEELGPTSPPLKMRPAATAARAGGSGGRGAA